MTPKAKATMSCINHVYRGFLKYPSTKPTLLVWHVSREAIYSLVIILPMNPIVALKLSLF